MHDTVDTGHKVMVPIAKWRIRENANGEEEIQARLNDREFPQFGIILSWNNENTVQCVYYCFLNKAKVFVIQLLDLLLDYLVEYWITKIMQPSSLLNYTFII